MHLKQYGKILHEMELSEVAKANWFESEGMKNPVKEQQEDSRRTGSGVLLENISAAVQDNWLLVIAGILAATLILFVVLPMRYSRVRMRERH